ncbi:hypothetical protein D0Z07_8650 [Hyphodiscus hymeniophilus]|uniref:Alpha-L-rhamnosidase n=1 Tax=Hyphodiscus hymeniophilus TaxID=353542 RepID=A0A9P6VDT0_9HELO|nr:hypothetical protein D0Z07_8650 [Hyphodiscus hymeniophilus]
MVHHGSLFLRSFIASLVMIMPVIATPTPASPAYQLQQLGSSSSSDDWQKYIRSPSAQIIYPQSIVVNGTLGNVTNADGLLTGHGKTILTRPAPENGSAADSSIPTIIVDFGQNIPGYLSIKFGGAYNSTPGLPGIRLAFSESIQYGYLTDVSDFSRSDNIAVKSYPYTWTDIHGCEYSDQVCADGIHGFRYVKIYMDALDSDAPYTSNYGAVSIDSLSLNISAFLGTPDTFTGWFESSDDKLNQWWYDGVYTNDLCTDVLDANSTDPRNAASPGMLGKLVILDGAKRDRLPYIGDLAVSARTSYLSHDVPEATRNVLADLANHQRADGWIPPASINNYTLLLLDYPLWWIACTYDLFMYTGDTDFVVTYYQTMINVLDDFYPAITDNTTQMITKGIGSSGSYGDYAFINRSGPITYLNALYVIALDNAASMATYLGHRQDAARWSARSMVVAAAINTYNFDSSVGAFFDGSCGDTYCATHAQDGNSLSILSGAANVTRATSALAYLAAHNARFYGNAFYDNDVVAGGYSQRVYTFISYFEIEARFKTGLADSALEEIRRLYGWMEANDPGITMWEGIGQGGQPYEGAFTSLAHGWGTGVVPALTNYVLGVMPQGPGFSIFSVKPIPGDVQWAKGVVPTPHGPIYVAWDSNQAVGLFYLSVSAPTGTKGAVSVPVGNSSVPVYVDNELAWENNGHAYAATYENYADAGYVSVQVEGGDHVITAGYSI